MAKNKQFALVLFDHDGCTAIVETKKHPSVVFVMAGRITIKWGGARQLVEVLEVSDLRSDLDRYEDQWFLSHRAQSLDDEKQRRVAAKKSRFGGYASIWPSDETSMNSANGTANHVVPDKQTEARRQKETSINSARKKQTANPVVPDKQTKTQKEMVQHTNSKKNSADQTDKVVIVQNKAELKAAMFVEATDKSTQTDGESQLDSLNTKLDTLMMLVRAMATPDVLDGTFMQGILSGQFSFNEIATPTLLTSVTASTPVNNGNMCTPARNRDVSPLVLDTRLAPATTPDFNLMLPSQPVHSTEPDTISETEQSSATIDPPTDDVPLDDTTNNAGPGMENVPPAVTTQVNLHQRSGNQIQVTCNAGPIIEITNGMDMASVPAHAEVRILPTVTRTAKVKSCSKGNFAWSMAKTVYQTNELIGRNYYGNKGKEALSPRRLHAISHAVDDMYGMGADNIKTTVNALNTGIRNIARKIVPLSTVENNGQMYVVPNNFNN